MQMIAKVWRVLLFCRSITQYCLLSCRWQVVRVIWREATLQPHMDGSVVFARWRQCALHLIHCTRVHIPNSISVSSAVFAQLTAESPCTWQWTVPFPPQITTLHGGSGRIGYMVPCAHSSPQPKRHLDWFSRFCRAHDSDGQTYRQTDHTALS